MVSYQMLYEIMYVKKGILDYNFDTQHNSKKRIVKERIFFSNKKQSNKHPCQFLNYFNNFPIHILAMKEFFEKILKIVVL